MRILMLASLAACLLAGPLAAQDNAELLNRMKTMEDRIKALEAEVQALKGQQAVAAPTTPAAAAPTQPAAPPPEPVAAQAPAGQPTLGGLGAGAAKSLNPDISAIGDFI